ncbi:MAG: hypothetical protein JWQ27_2755 [Ferruginibacter sp.]|nr:hypothetical protein [Ferruginibacter sp.]
MQKIIVLLIALSIVQSMKAQENSRAYYKSQSTVALGYGIGNVWKRVFKANAPNGGASYDINSTGPVSLVYEYGFTKRISGGIALGYSQVKAVLTYGPLINTERLTNYSALARANYHFGHDPKWDLYAGGGIGYYKFTYDSKDNSGNNNSGSGIKVPGAFGSTAELGAKYYVKPCFAVFAEAGYVAGSYGQLGVNVRF